MKLLISILFTWIVAVPGLSSPLKEEAILGKWMSSENNLEVEIYRANNEFKARIIWFDDSDNPSEPARSRLDIKNPDKTLRTRKLIGMEVLTGLTFNSKDEEWQNGHIYDCSSGKKWNAKLWLTKEGTLKVRGYWHFEFLGENMSFKKV